MPAKKDATQTKDPAAGFQRHGQDVGSPEVQVARLTNRIQQVTQHLKRSPKDRMARRGLLQMVGRRRRCLDWLMAHRPADYDTIIKRLKLRK